MCVATWCAVNATLLLTGLMLFDVSHSVESLFLASNLAQLVCDSPLHFSGIF